ncbi:MAG: hypothetical protein AB7F40_11620, partial [Victivallaceae bacterium]
GAAIPNISILIVWRECRLFQPLAHFPFENRRSPSYIPPCCFRVPVGNQFSGREYDCIAERRGGIKAAIWKEVL